MTYSNNYKEYELILPCIKSIFTYFYIWLNNLAIFANCNGPLVTLILVQPQVVSFELSCDMSIMIRLLSMCSPFLHSVPHRTNNKIYKNTPCSGPAVWGLSFRKLINHVTY